MTWTAGQDVGPVAGLDAISCLRGGFCAAVADGGQAITAQGHRWAPPTQVLGGGSTLEDVSCASTTMCIAVTDDGNAYRYAGAAWRRMPPPDPGYRLNGVSCPTTTFCMAVDQFGRALTYQQREWSTPSQVVPIPLTAVSCASPTLCAAVSGATRVVVVFDGAQWVPTYFSTDVRLIDVGCAASGFCMTTDQNGLSFAYRAGVWRATSPSPLSDTIGEISCTSARFCFAETWDFYFSTSIWDGTQWSTPESFATRPDGVIAVSCAATRRCVAVGGDLAYYGTPAPG